MPTKILVVDDEPDLELMISQKFRKQVRDKELQFDFVKSGVEALNRLQTNGEPDVILTDINMPEMDGLTLLAKLSEQYPLIKSVIVSAYGDMSNIRTALNRGAFDFVTKPIDFNDLEITLKKTIHEALAFKQAVKDRDQLLSIQQELEVARKIQQSIVPRKFPAFPGRKEFDLYAEMIPAKDVGGDFYDFFLIDDDRLGFVIGDVSGKGVPAALFMAVSKTLLKATALKGLPPDECLQQINRVLHLESVSAMFVTIFYGILNTRTGEVDYCNGGHNPPYILRAGGGVEMVASTGGLVLGAMRNTAYHAKKMTLQSGDGIFLYTDGVTEAMNRDNEQFTEERLEEKLKAGRDTTLPNIVGHVIEAVKAFSNGAPQADDITILALRYLGK
ncbi:MAG: SpoIIE family protein phosphatase [candidate division KSB1 bacterium]|nr:SpoIIE family protein phosphatase [candidate division KSB1 bacterium]MDZ7369385.1 SpoIIE family protein phosphatase [candidate division KSB1 bacterium]MDZ7407475.1 SpoIIE family protein phosphatase [candidate division KSB1 bacterium]